MNLTSAGCLTGFPLRSKPAANANVIPTLDKRMKNFIYNILPIILAVVGIAVSVYLDYIDDKNSLTLYMKSQHTIIKNDANITDLVLTFRGHTIEELYSTRFLLENEGHNFIEKSDVIKPIEVIFNDTSILDIRIHHTIQTNLDVKIEQTQSNELLVNFSLLNPNDKIEFDVLTTTPITSFTATTRIKGLTELDSFHYVENPPLIDRVTSYQIYAIPLSIFILLFFWLSARKLVVPIRSTAFFIKDKLKDEDFNKEFFLKFLKQSTEGRLDEDTFNKIEKRLEETDISNQESLSKFREATFLELLNRDLSGSMTIALLALFIWVLYNIFSLVYSLISV